MTKPIRILLVEDNPADADLTKETLESGRLFLEIDVVQDGTEAVAFLKNEPPFENAKQPDMILLDLNLPRVDGRTVLRTIKATEQLKKIPVVILTSSDAESDIVASYDLGANCYVTKPVGLKEFQAIIRSVEGFWFTIVKLP